VTRPYYSPSAIATARRCERAWAFLYLDGLRDAPVAWDDIESGRVVVAPRTRSLSLGGAVHAVGEAVMGDGPDEPQWASFPGQVFAPALECLPRKSQCARIEVERAIGDDPTGLPLGRPQTTRTIHGVRWAGFRDLAFWLDADGPPTQVDYKTTASIARYAKTADALRTDLQAAVYTYDLAEREGLTSVSSRWIYLETKKVRRAMPVDFTLSRDEALDVIAPAARLARHLDTVASSAEAEPNTESCWDYGGCPYHARAGGPCTATPSLRAFFAREKAKGTRMPLDTSLVKKFGALPAPPPPPAADAAPAPATPAAPPPAAPTPEPPKPAKRTSRKTAAKTTPATPAPADGLAAKIGALHAELASAEANVAAANDALDAVILRMREALS